MKTLTLALLLLTGLVQAADYPLDAPAMDSRRSGGTISKELAAPVIPDDENKDIKHERNYPDQPPTIPHTIRGYQITSNANKCLSCHNRANSAINQAPMISATHYMDRDGQVLAAVSPRRYFCVQCHVPQKEVKPLIENNFRTIDEVLRDAVDKTSKQP